MFDDSANLCFCLQYPDWLEKNCNSVSEADLKRYKKQLQIMTTICDEFEKPGREGGEGQGQSVSERILQLMQELQRYGQPPADLATEAVSQWSKNWCMF